MTAITISNLAPYTFEGIPTSENFSLDDKPDWYLRIVSGYPIVEGLCRIPSRDTLIKQIRDFGLPNNNRFADMDMVEIYNMAKSMEIEHLFNCAIFDERFFYFFQDMGIKKLTKKFLEYTVKKFHTFFKKSAENRGLKLVLGQKGEKLSLEKRKITIKIDYNYFDSVVCTRRLKVYKTSIYGTPKSFDIYSGKIGKYISKKLDITSPTFYCVMKKKHQKVDKVPLVQIDTSSSNEDLQADEIFEIDI